jgi:hypothetical protein
MNIECGEKNIATMGMRVMSVEYEYNSQRGFLNKVEVITTETIVIDSNLWLDAKYIQLLLLIDEEWRTLSTLRNYSYVLRTESVSVTNSMLSKLEDMGLIESTKKGSKHKQYRRMEKLPKHRGG